MTQFNKRLCDALDIETPEAEPSVPLDPTQAMVMVEPHELVTVDNPDLPEMADIDRAQAEGEKQLEIVIRNGLNQIDMLKDKYAETDPRYRNRLIENSNQAMSVTLDAIKFKNELQMKKKDLRMKEAGYRQPDGSGAGPNGEGSIFTGSREDLMRAISVPTEEVQDSEEKPE